MAKGTQTFYFDEAGFTGNNLLDPEQPVFVYAGVAIDEKRASALRAEALSRFRLNASELKGSNLLKTDRGVRAISWILNESSQYSHIMVANKEYALAGKFFEYIFEPALAERNSLFYGVGFHKFIAMILYIFFRAKDSHTQDILRSFTKMMKDLDPQRLEAILSSLDHVDQSSPIGKILAFAYCHRRKIENEVRVVKKSDIANNWSLELSMTALNWLLASWGEEYESLEVYCDNSKPIQASIPMFDNLIGREDKVYLQFGNHRNLSIIYNLSGPINTVDSKKVPGVQIADVIATSVAYSYKNPEEDISKEWLGYFDDVAVNMIAPDLTLVDFTKEDAFVNGMILDELVDRSIRGEDLFEDMIEFILGARLTYRQHNQSILFE